MSARRTLVTAAALAAALLLGLWLGQRYGTDARAPGAPGSTTEGPCPGGGAPTHWRAPMDPAYVRDAPGKSPMGMDLVPVCPTAGRAPGVVEIDPATVQNIGVRTALVEERKLSRLLRAVGRVAYDERRVTHVHTKVQGWVEHLTVDYVGHAVERGQPLLEIYSPELLATQEELLLAARYRDATSASPFEDVASGGVSLFDATRRRLVLWDVSELDIDRLIETGEVKRTLTLYAPSSGVVTDLRVRSGMEVAPNTNLYTIADLSEVWLVADVYEYELPWIELGQTGSVEFSYLPGVVFSGQVTYISPFLDPKTRTAEVRLELPNPEGRLKPEMFGTVVIETQPRIATAIPSEAIIRSGRRTLAVVALGDGRFAPREIEIGIETGEGWTEVGHGLQPGDRVVVSSQFLIDSESNLQEALQKLLAPQDKGPEASSPLPDAAGEGPGMDHDMHSHEGH